MYNYYISICFHHKILYNIDMKTNNFTNKNTTSTDSVTISRAQYEQLMSLQSMNNMLKSRANQLEQVLDLFKRNDFGSKSEKTNKDLQEQIGRLFDEAELIQNAEQKAAETVEVKSNG